MASASNWSVVGKTKKGKSPGLTKTQKKQFMDNMPRIEVADPVQESSTIYDAFVQQEQQRYEKKQQEKFADKIEAGKEPNGKGLSDGAAKKKASQKGKKTERVSRKPFEDAVKQVLEEDLKSVLLQSKGHFPEKPELWLKDLVTYLNMKLEMCPESDKYLKKENTDFPASSLKKGCTKVLTSVLQDCNMATLDHVLYFCVNTMLEESQTGVSTFGFKIFIQLLVRSNPQVVMSKLQQYKDLVKSTQNRPDRCMSVLWVLGQVGFPNFKAGLRVWLDVMFPCLGFKSIGGYCMQYLEIILSLHGKSLDKGINEIKMKEFFAIFDQVYGSSLPTDIRRRLGVLYPQIKKLSINESSKSTNLRNFFPSFLVRASNSNPEVYKCLVECLSVDQQSFSLWCQLYLKQLPQSRLLLHYLSENWEKLPWNVDSKLMKQTLMTFVRTNEESGQFKNANELAEMTAVCEEFLKKMSRPRFPWRWVIFFLVTTVIGVVVYDVYTSKTVKECKIVRFLEMYGVLGILQQIWEVICSYTNITVRWLQVNVPVYYSRVNAAVTPLVEKMAAYWVYVEEQTRESRHAAVSKVYSWAPDMWDQLGHYLLLCWDFILEYSYWIQGHIATLYKYVYHWVDVNVINGDYSSQNIKQTLSWSASRVQNITVSAINWCSQLWT